MQTSSRSSFMGGMGGALIISGLGGAACPTAGSGIYEVAWEAPQYRWPGRRRMRCRMAPLCAASLPYYAVAWEALPIRTYDMQIRLDDGPRGCGIVVVGSVRLLVESCFCVLGWGSASSHSLPVIPCILTVLAILVRDACQRPRLPSGTLYTFSLSFAHSRGFMWRAPG